MLIGDMLGGSDCIGEELKGPWSVNLGKVVELVDPRDRAISADGRAEGAGPGVKLRPS